MRHLLLSIPLSLRYNVYSATPHSPCLSIRLFYQVISLNQIHRNVIRFSEIIRNIYDGINLPCPCKGIIT